MALFSTKETTEVSVPEREQGEKDLIQQLQQLLGAAQGQMGDLSGLASGQLPQLSPEMVNLIETIGRGAATSQTEALQRQAQEQKVALEGSLAGRGIDASSIAAVQEGLIDRNVLEQTGDIERARADQVANLMYQTPFNVANTQLTTNQLLMNLLTGVSGQLNENFLRDRLARTTSTTTGGTNPFTSMFGLGQSIAGAGGFNPLLEGLGKSSEDKGE